MSEKRRVKTDRRKARRKKAAGGGGGRLNYLPALIELSAAAGATPGALMHMTVEHDDWCPALHGQAECTCNPIVRMGRPDRRDTH